MLYKQHVLRHAPTGVTSVVIKACHETLHNTLTKMTQGKKTGSWRELGQSLYWNRGMITCDLGRTESSSIYMYVSPSKTSFSQKYAGIQLDVSEDSEKVTPTF